MEGSYILKSDEGNFDVVIVNRTKYTTDEISSIIDEIPYLIFYWKKGFGKDIWYKADTIVNKENIYCDGTGDTIKEAIDCLLLNFDNVELIKKDI